MSPIHPTVKRLEPKPALRDPAIERWYKKGKWKVGELVLGPIGPKVNGNK